jgi:hypothetical protein
MEEVEGQVAVRMALSGPLNDKRVGSIGSKHSERTRRFSRLRLDVAVSATGWSEPVCGRELRPPKSSAFMAHCYANQAAGTCVTCPRHVPEVSCR